MGLVKGWEERAKPIGTSQRATPQALQGWAGGVGVGGIDQWDFSAVPPVCAALAAALPGLRPTGTPDLPYAA